MKTLIFANISNMNDDSFKNEVAGNVCLSSIVFFFLLELFLNMKSKTKRKRSDSVLCMWQKPLYQQKIVKGNVTKNDTKTMITHQLQTDLEYNIVM